MSAFRDLYSALTTGDAAEMQASFIPLSAGGEMVFYPLIEVGVFSSAMHRPKYESTFPRKSTSISLHGPDEMAIEPVVIDTRGYKGQVDSYCICYDKEVVWVQALENPVNIGNIEKLTLQDITIAIE